MILKERLRNVKINKGESVVSYLTKIRQARDELAVVGETIDSIELVAADIDEFSSRFDEDFALIACLSSSGTKNTGVWYIDNDASSHMTRAREYFSSYREEETIL